MYQNLIRTMSLLTRKTSNDLGSLLELPGNLLMDYYRQVEDELIEEYKEKKRQIEKQKAERDQQTRMARARKSKQSSGPRNSNLRNTRPRR